MMGAVSGFNWRHNRNICFWISCSLVGLILFVRMGDILFVFNSLWAEDGNVFLNQAYLEGWSSIFKSYAGYLHLYPRLLSIWAVHLPLNFVPVLFCSAWVLMAVILTRVIVNRISDRDLSLIFPLVIPALIFAQPASGEVFFTITNAQWVMACILVIYLFVPVGESMSPTSRKGVWLEATGIGVIGLTGPFSIIISPVLIFGMLRNSLPKPRLIYVALLVSSCVQIYVLVHSDRNISSGVDADLKNWFSALQVFFLFGVSNSWQQYLLIIYWLIWLYIFFKLFNERVGRQDNRDDSILMLMLVLIMMYASGLYVSRESPQLIHPLLNGARYFFIPYTLLIFLIIPVFSRSKYAAAAMAFILVVVSLANLGPISRADLQFRAYASLAKKVPELSVPINPVWPVFPGWYIQVSQKEKYAKSDESLFPIALDTVHLINADSYFVGDKLIISPTSEDAQLFLPVIVNCKGSSYLGVVVNMTRMEPGWSQLFWSYGEGFSERYSLRRFYPKGDVEAYYAVKISQDSIYIRIDPAETSDEIKISQIAYYCL